MGTTTVNETLLLGFKPGLADYDIINVQSHIKIAFQNFLMPLYTLETANVICGTQLVGIITLLYASHFISKRAGGTTTYMANIICGSAHTLCLMKSNLLLGWGNNEEGGLGLGHKNNVKEPMPINVADKKVIDVFAVDLTSVAVTEDGAIYVCGKFGGKHITRPQEIKAEYARDLLAKGAYAMTGGCARLSTDLVGMVDRLTKDKQEYLLKLSSIQTKLSQLESDGLECKLKLGAVETKLSESESERIALKKQVHALQQENTSLSTKLQGALDEVLNRWSGPKSNPSVQQYTADVPAGASIDEPHLMAQIMKENAVFFVGNLTIDASFLASLHQSGILTSSHEEVVDAKTTQDDKRTALRHFILQRGPKVPAAFLNALLVSKQQHVITEILHNRDKYENNGAQQLLDAVDKYFGGEVLDELRKIYDGSSR